MSLFNKNKKKDTAPAAQTTPAPQSDAEPLIVEPTLDKTELLQIIAEKCPGAEKQGDWLLYKKHMLRVTIEFGEMQCIKGSYNVQLLLIAQHPWFDEDLVESVAGFGGNPDDALRRGTEHICAGVMSSLLPAFDCEGESFIEADVRGEKHLFRVPCVRPGLHMGAGKGTDLFSLIEDKLPEYLGTKRCYWIKLYTATINGSPTCEVRINGTVFPSLTEYLLKEAVQRPAQAGLISDKEFLLLIQKEETWKPCPFTKQQVGELTFRAFQMMQEIHDEVSANHIMNAIRRSAPNPSLGTELAAFIPEIVCQIVINYLDNDGLMPVVNYGKPDVELKKSQVRSYGYIEDAVFQYLRKQNPSEDEIRQILAISGKFHVLSDAIQNGAKLEDLKLSQLVYFVDENYQVW